MYSFEHFRKSTIWHAAQKASPPCIVAVGLMLSVFLFCICVESAFFALACSTRFFRLDNFYGSESKESNFHHLQLYLARVSSGIGSQLQYKGGKVLFVVMFRVTILYRFGNLGRLNCRYNCQGALFVTVQSYHYYMLAKAISPL